MKKPISHQNHAMPCPSVGVGSSSSEAPGIKRISRTTSSATHTASRRPALDRRGDHRLLAGVPSSTDSILNRERMREPTGTGAGKRTRLTP